MTDEPSGLIIGGSDNGLLTVWSAAKVAARYALYTHT